jgi:hypothetical protein
MPTSNEFAQHCTSVVMSSAHIMPITCSPESQIAYVIPWPGCGRPVTYKLVAPSTPHHFMSSQGSLDVGVI